VFCRSLKEIANDPGIGGALTDASAETFAKLPPRKQREILDAYFDPNKGIGTRLKNQHHSCDFSSGSYTYATKATRAESSASTHDRDSHSLHQKGDATAGGKLTSLAAMESPAS